MKVSSFFLFLTPFLYANELLNVEQVLNSTKENYPQVLEVVEDIEVAKAKVRAAIGNFDLKLKGKGDIRTEGYYDGRSFDLILEKPLQILNSSLYSGFRNQRGEFPVYEGKALTLDNGEMRAGIKFSLLQDRDIDERRAELGINKLELRNKELKVQSIKVKAQKEAYKAYWNWVAKGNIFEVYKKLLKIAIDRNDALLKRIKRGDLAEIYRTENEQYILKRTNQKILAERDFLESTLYLSLFYRNKDGGPQLPKATQLPREFNGEKNLSEEQVKEDLKRAISIHPELGILEIKSNQLSIEEALGDNKLNPRVDVQFEVSRDRGLGSSTLQGTENRAMVNVEIPIERNLGKGKVRAAKAAKTVIGHQARLFRDTLEAKINSLFYTINTAVETIENSQREVKLAEILEKAEERKFKQGDSDFFVVNLREQSTADARVKNIKAHLEYKKSEADYQESTFGPLFFE